MFERTSSFQIRCTVHHMGSRKTKKNLQFLDLFLQFLFGHWLLGFFHQNNLIGQKNWEISRFVFRELMSGACQNMGSFKVQVF